MSERGWETTTLDELEPATFRQNVARLPLRKHFDVGAFGINAYRADQEGAQVIEEHDEVGPNAGRHEELYLVLSGRATFTVAGEEVDGPPGTVVFVRDPATRRGAVAREAGTTVLAVGGARGNAFTVSDWEDMSGLSRYFDEGDYTGAIAFMGDFLEQHPGHAGGLFNLACAESLAGKADDALEHLAAAVEKQEDLRELARNDEDFAPLRDDPRFLEIVGA